MSFYILPKSKVSKFSMPSTRRVYNMTKTDLQLVETIWLRRRREGSGKADMALGGGNRSGDGDA